MRAFLILCVLVFTLMTFYSALWYKSEEIQTDITTRVTDELNTAEAKDVAIDVDGRHVTLSGVVYDQATEASYLETANDTYGALGPIDGLTYLSGGGFVKAVKSAEGITLDGSVPSEDARASLIAAATASTDGEITDNLTIGGPAGDWQAEAGFGLGKLGELSTGALAVTPGSYTLSGTAQNDAAPVQTELSERAGWQAFVSSPGVEMGLSDEVTRLRADVSDRDETIIGLNQSVDAAETQRNAAATALAAMTLNRDVVGSERDAVTDELNTLRASLTDNQSTAASLASDLEAANAGIKARNTTIAVLNGKIDGLGDTNQALEKELADRQVALNGDQQQVASLQAKVDVQSATIAGMASDLDAGKAQIAALETSDGVKSATIAGMASDLDAGKAQIAALETSDGVKSATIAGMASDLDAGKAQIAALEAKSGVQSATIAGMGSELDASKAQIASLQGNLSDLGSNGDAATAKIADLSGKLADSEGEVTTLKGLLADQSGNDADAAARIAALTANVGDLSAVVEDRDATIVRLQNAKPAPAAPTTNMADQCSARAGQVLTDTQINFATATARIARGSIPTLERLTGIALACADSGLTMEIGGHTDSQGSDAANQALSERRANAIADFMSERGVPTDGLKPVGFGEAKPIGDNATAAGRAANRRISFEWQAR